MQTQKVVITRPDGGVSIMGFIVEGRGTVLPDGAVWFSNGVWAREPSDKNIAAEVAKSVPDYMAWRRIDDAEVPTDRTFRDALTDTGKLEYDLVKAKQLKIESLRHDRATEFPELDALWMKAIGQGDLKTAADIEAKRRALRDVTADPRIEAAATVEELKAVELPK